MKKKKIRIPANKRAEMKIVVTGLALADTLMKFFGAVTVTYGEIRLEKTITEDADFEIVEPKKIGNANTGQKLP